MADTKHPLGDVGAPGLGASQYGDVRVVRARIQLATTKPLNDRLFVAVYPANHVLVDAILWAADLDSNGTPTIALDVGVLDTIQTGGDTTDADAIFDGVTTAQSGGVVRPTLATAFQIADRSYDRTVTVTIATGFATFQAGELGLNLFFAPRAPNGLHATVTL